MRPEGRWVHGTASSGCGLVVRSGSSGSYGCTVRFAVFLSGSTGVLGCTLGVAWIVQVRLVRLGAHLGSLGSFGFIWFVRVCPCDRWVRFRSFSTSECALRFICFVAVRPGVVQVRLVCSGARRG